MEKWKDRKNTGIVDMNVEKLREVGQKIGYEGEELNEFVEEQLAYQLEEERLEAEEREARCLHEEWRKQMERKLSDLEAREQLQDQEGIEQSHIEDVMEEIPEQGIWYPLDDDAAEEDALKIDEDTVVEGSCDDNCEMDPETKVATLVKDKAKGLAKVANEQQSGVEECCGRTDGEFLTSNPDGVNAGVWVNTTASSTQGECLGTVVHDFCGAREQLQDQEGIVQSDMEMPMQRMGHPLNEDTPAKDSCESEVMTSEEKASLIEDKTWGLEEVLKRKQLQESGAEEKDLLNVEQVLMELGAWEQLQNQEGIGQSHVKRAEPEGATEATSSGKILLESAGLAWMETAEIESEDSNTEEVFSSESLLESGDVSQNEMGNDIGFDEGLAEGQFWKKEGMVSLWDKAVPRRPMWAESEDVLADKLQKAASATQVVVLQLDEEIQAANDKVPMMEIDIEGQNAMALKDLLKASMGKSQVIFSDKPGRCKLVKHRKQLTSDVPVQSWPYTIPYAVRQELVRLKLAGLAARPSKCVIGAKTVQLLGHHVGDGMLGLGRDNLEKVG